MEGRICKTNTVSNTAFRGFGGPQGMMIHCAIMTAVADKLDMHLEEIFERNLYKEGERTHFGQQLVDWNVPAMIAQIRESADFDCRRQDIDRFNTENRWKKRGISLIPTKFGISFTFLTLNQGSALLHIYAHDGSVGLYHGGVEMGQGAFRDFLFSTLTLMPRGLQASIPRWHKSVRPSSKSTWPRFSSWRLTR